MWSASGSSPAAGTRNHRSRGRRRPRRVWRADHGRLPRPSSVCRQPELGAHAGGRRRRFAGGPARRRANECATRSRAGGLPAGADGRCYRPRYEPGTFRPRAHGGVRARRACACRARPLRRARVRGAPALDRNWHPHRARGDAGQVRALVCRQAATVVSLGVAAGLGGARCLGAGSKLLRSGSRRRILES